MADAPNKPVISSAMLNKLGLGRLAPAAKERPATPANPMVLERQLLAKHREMVRLAVKGTLKEHGLGATWVGSHVQFAASTDQGSAMADALNIRLIVQEWREELLRYLPALQKKIIESLGRVEPGINHNRHTMTWEFAPDCGCTVHDLPAPASWSAKASVRKGPGSRLPARREFDLPPSALDHIGDERDDIPSTFAATQPGFLNSTPPDFSKSTQ
jgi:hypothetical protein